MGLCKCSKRRVTNLFCFVHRVNVCEDCMIAQHSRCVVHSYLKWLEDSDYDDICVLCTNSIQQGQVVRLTCYDLLHQSCLESYIRRFSNVELRCPRCKEILVPPDNLLSPVASQLKCILQTMREVSSTDLQEEKPVLQVSVQGMSSPRELTSTPRESLAPLPGYTRDNMSSVRGVDYTDHDENKYRRKPWMETIRNWIRSHQSYKTVDSDMRGVRRSLFLVALIVLVIVTVIVLLTRVGREVANKDAALDWNLNPNLRTGN